MKLLLLSLCFSLGLSTQVDQYVKNFLSKPPDADGCLVIGFYTDLIVCANNIIYFLDANTGDFVSGIDSKLLNSYDDK